MHILFGNRSRRGSRDRALALALGAVLAACAAACGQLPAQGTTSQDPIFGGTVDTTHDAVTAFIDQLTTTTASACSGTTIAVAGSSGIFLTAGHCVVAKDSAGHVTTPIKVSDSTSLFVVPGPDWQASIDTGLYYGVGRVAVHPQYDGSVDSPYDVALVRFLGAVPAQPTIPVLTAADDHLAVGSDITVVGFGKTLSDATNTTRYDVARVLASITANQFVYSQTDDKGTCEGDSGGPALYQLSAGSRVAGITSYGDSSCTMVGASVRISPVVVSFIQPFIDAAPKTLSCDDCASAKVSPGNACVDQSEACAATSSACGQFVSCASACATSACVSQCAQSNAPGAAAYDAVVACQCSHCATECASYQACGGTGVGGAAGAAAGSSGGATGAGGNGSAGAKVSGSGTSDSGCDVAAEAPGGSNVVVLAALALGLRRSRGRQAETSSFLGTSAAD